MNQQIASAAVVIGFLICIATALVLALRAGSKQRGAQSARLQELATKQLCGTDDP